MSQVINCECGEPLVLMEIVTHPLVMARKCPNCGKRFKIRTVINFEIIAIDS